MLVLLVRSEKTPFHHKQSVSSTTCFILLNGNLIVPHSMNNSMWVPLHPSPVSSCLIPINSMWVPLHLCSVSSCLIHWHAGGQWYLIVQSHDMSFIPWQTGSEWDYFVRHSRHVSSHDKQEVSDTEISILSSSHIMSQSHDQQKVTPHFSCARSSHIASLIQWPTGGE